jgi:alkylhydroperoxidase/carboxymuconolactone decarboxylase family protein YurZ
MDARQKLLHLLLQDEAFLRSILRSHASNLEASGLDPRLHALIRLGVLLALEAPSVSYQWNVDAAFAAGVTPEEIVGCLVAAAPLIGIPRVAKAVPDLAMMIGYDLDTDLESPQEA